MKKCSVSLVIREMQIKATVRHQLIPDSIAIIWKSKCNKCRGCRKEGTQYTVGENASWYSQLVQWWEIVWRFLRKLKIGLATILTPGKHPKETQSARGPYLPFNVTTAQLSIAQAWDQPSYPPPDGQIEKTTDCNWATHKQQWKSDISNKMDATGEHFANWNKLVSERQITSFLRFAKVSRWYKNH